VGSDPLRHQLERARDLGFLGPGPVGPHLHHAELLLTVLVELGAPSDPLRALDLGSGGGLPGLVLAHRWPRSHWVLLDANERRTAFLGEAVAALGMTGRVEVRRERAERAGRDPNLREGVDLVTARSFGPPAVTAECGAPFLVEGGLLAVSEPPTPDPERWPADHLASLGLILVTRGSWALLRRVGPLSDRIPRRDGVPARRPWW
jgi:16S rRNA (guanine527-N7)-methyltransferase